MCCHNNIFSVSQHVGDGPKVCRWFAFPFFVISKAGGSLLDDATTYHSVNCCLPLAHQGCVTRMNWHMDMAQRGFAHGNTGEGFPGWHWSPHWAGSLASRCTGGDNAGLINFSSHVQTGGSQVMNYR